MSDADDKIEWKIEKRSLSSLKGLENNPRILTDHMHDQLKKSLIEDGNHGVLKINSDGTIIGGNQRASILKELGEEMVDVKVSTRLLSDEEVKRVSLRDNKVQAQFDYEILANYYDVNLLQDCGFTPEDLGGFNPDDIEQIESDEDDEETDVEPPKEPETKKGDVYELGEHRLMCGDSVAITDVEKLLNGESMELVYTDPPYGINEHCDRKEHSKTFKKQGVAKKGKYEQIIGDESIQTAMDAINLCEAISVPTQIFWGGNYYDLPPSACWIVWDKRVEENQSDINSDCELAYVRHKHKASVRIFRHLWKGMIKASERGENRVHPTQKPVALATWCFENYAKDAINVLDLFGGSGSTLIACEQTKRKCFMMELSPNYCDVIVNRWVDFMKKNGKDATVKRNGDIVEMSKRSVEYGKKTR